MRNMLKLLLIGALINSCQAKETAPQPVVGIEVTHNFDINASLSNLFLSMCFNREVFVRVYIRTRTFMNCATTCQTVAAQKPFQYAAHLDHLIVILKAFVAQSTTPVVELQT